MTTYLRKVTVSVAFSLLGIEVPDTQDFRRKDLFGITVSEGPIVRPFVTGGTWQSSVVGAGVAEISHLMVGRKQREGEAQDKLFPRVCLLPVPSDFLPSARST